MSLPGGDESLSCDLGPWGPRQERTAAGQVVPASDWDQRLRPFFLLHHRLLSSPPLHRPNLEKARDCPGISPPRTAASLSPVLTCLEMELIESPWIYCFSFFSLRETVTLVFISKTLFQPFNSVRIQLPRPSVNTFQHTSPQKPVWQRLCCPSPSCLLPPTIPRPPSRLSPGD